MTEHVKEQLLKPSALIGNWEGIKVAQYEHDEIIATLISLIPLDCSPDATEKTNAVTGTC